MYNPAGGDDTEFVEVANISSTEMVHLTGVRFSRGIQFTFPEGLWLAPGQSVVVVKSRAAFVAAYPGVLETLIAGEFERGTSLANGGEALVLLAADGSTLREVTYDDAAPWPTGADGDGASIELKTPLENPDPNLAGSWQIDKTPGGSPGILERTPVDGFTGNPHADLDGDGLQALLEYATGRSDDSSDIGSMPFETAIQSLEVNGETAQYFTYTFVRNNTRQDVTMRVEMSRDLAVWSSSSEEVVLHTENIGNVHDQVVYRSSKSISDASGAAYFRLAAELKLP
jgi:hypothetical protein